MKIKSICRVNLFLMKYGIKNRYARYYLMIFGGGGGLYGFSKSVLVTADGIYNWGRTGKFQDETFVGLVTLPFNLLKYSILGILLPIYGPIYIKGRLDSIFSYKNR